MCTLARWTVRGLTFLALLLLIATVAVWVRSYYVRDCVGRIHSTTGIPNEDHHVWLEANHGILYLIGGGDPVENFKEVHWEYDRRQADAGSGLWGKDAPSYLRRVGLSWENERRVSSGEFWWSASVRMALPATLCGLATLLLLGRPWRWFLRRAGEGMCPGCGYDLRAYRPLPGMWIAHRCRGGSYPDHTSFSVPRAARLGNPLISPFSALSHRTL